jgi:hypothetical protein
MYRQFDPYSWTVEMIFLSEDRIVVASHVEIRAYDLSSVTDGHIQPFWSLSLSTCLDGRTPGIVRVSSNFNSATCAILNDDKLFKLRLFFDEDKTDVSVSYLPIDFSNDPDLQYLSYGSGAVSMHDCIILFSHRNGDTGGEWNCIECAALMVKDILPPPYQNKRWHVARFSLDLLSGLMIIQSGVKPLGHPQTMYDTRLFKLW